MRVLLDMSITCAVLAAALAPGYRPTSHEPARVAIAADSVREYRGVYESAFEASWFHPCDAPSGDDLWWVTLSDAALRQRDSLAARVPAAERVGKAVFVRWRATVSDRMQAGHMGRGSRYMLVTEVLEVRPASGVGCSST